MNHDNIKNLLSKEVIRNRFLKIGTKNVVKMCCWK